MAVRTFPFEVIINDDPRRIDNVSIETVDARETAHPLLVIHGAIKGDRPRGKWILAHGPTSRVWHRSDKVSDLVRLAKVIHKLDPDCEMLQFTTPTNVRVAGAGIVPPVVCALAREAREIAGL